MGTHGETPKESLEAPELPNVTPGEQIELNFVAAEASAAAGARDLGELIVERGIDEPTEDPVTKGALKKSGAQGNAELKETQMSELQRRLEDSVVVIMTLQDVLELLVDKPSLQAIEQAIVKSTAKSVELSGEIMELAKFR